MLKIRIMFYLKMISLKHRNHSLNLNVTMMNLKINLVKIDAHLIMNVLVIELAHGMDGAKV